MASGKLPGRSLGEQGSFEFLGRNVFTEYVFQFLPSEGKRTGMIDPAFFLFSAGCPESTSVARLHC